MIQGIDISHYDNDVDFNAFKAGGWEFMYAKVTEGTGNKDAKFKHYWEGAKAAGVICGGYHFFHPDQDPKNQANFFVSTMGAIGAGDLPPVMDLEVMGSMYAEDVISVALKFLRVVQAQTNKLPMIYLSPSMAQNLGYPTAFKQYPLWLAHYQKAIAPTVKPWPQWTMWQNSEAGNCPGLKGHVDTNYFNGNLAELQAFCK